MKLYLYAAGLLYLLDQVTKALILGAFALGDARVVIPGFFELVHVANTGAAFGMFQEFPWFFTVLKMIALGVIAYLVWGGRLHSRLSRTIAALLLAGVAGNLTDRLLHGYVVDFLSFDLHIPFANPWPAFNVADSCISFAAILLFLHAMRPSSGASKAGS